MCLLATSQFPLKESKIMSFFFRTFIHCHLPSKDLMGPYSVPGTVPDAEVKPIKPTTVLPLPKHTLK